MQTPIVRLLTCGSVDDGKSTLIGRLLVETDSVPHDTIDSTRKVRRAGSIIPAGEIDFSLLTDGLEAEREQGITIDVAYRSMSLLDGRRLISLMLQGTSSTRAIWLLQHHALRFR